MRRASRKSNLSLKLEIRGQLLAHEVTCAIILFFGAKGPLWVISVQPFWLDREAIQAKWVLFYAFAVFARHFRFGST